MPISKTLWLTLFITCTISPSITVSADWQEAIRQGDEFYAERHDANGGRENLEAAIKKYEEALGGIPKKDKKSRSGVCVKLSRSHFKLAYYFAKDDDETLELSDEGESWAKKAIKADPQNAEAYYWKAANLGLFRGIKRVSFRGGLMGGKIKEGFEKAAALDERCEYGCAYMRLGEYLLARGEAEEAKGYAEKSVEIEPRFLMSQIILAEILWENGDKAGARKILRHIAAQQEDVLPAEILENRHIIKKSKMILEDLEKGHDPDW
ncbi:MAG: tetratricopeptide repeat protein [Candidatus Brocadiales bacterium]